MNNRPKVNAAESAKFVFDLITLAKKWKEEKTLNSKFASSLIYANLAEFIADIYYSNVKNYINLKCFNHNSKIKLNTKIEKRTDLETSIKRLDRYTFPNKKEVMDLLYMIKDARNNLFHNLMRSKEKGINILAHIQNIQTKTDKLISIWLKNKNELLNDSKADF